MGECPVSVDVADMSFFIFAEPQNGHCGSLEFENMRSSLTFPHSSQ
jgi:hypothetical protein